MNNKFIKNKRTIMCLAAFMILCFHLWVTVFKGNRVETFIRRSGYVGVDIFFIVSAYSLAQRPIDNLKKYYLSRFEAVYVKFALFAVIAVIINKWSILRLATILTGVDLFSKGGGAFLWFLPAIVIWYIIFPLVQRTFKKRPWLLGVSLLTIWFIGGLLVTRYTGYKAFFIFWNRIPALTCGYLMASYGDKLNNLAGKFNTLARVLVSLALIIIGVGLVNKFGMGVKLNRPVNEMYYFMALPMAVGLILLVDFVPEILPLRLIGGATLEMYAVQMIWGFKWANSIYLYTKNAAITNLLVFVCVTGASICASKAYETLKNPIQRAIIRSDN